MVGRKNREKTGEGLIAKEEPLETERFDFPEKAEELRRAEGKNGPKKTKETLSFFAGHGGSWRRRQFP